MNQYMVVLTYATTFAESPEQAVAQVIQTAKEGHWGCFTITANPVISVE